MRGFSFSWKRALGISAAKGRLSRKLGVPLTRSGRQRNGLGCSVVLAMAGSGILAAAFGMAGCGSDSPTAPAGPPPTTLPARSAISISYDPDPVIATATGNTQFPWAYSYTLVIRETAGLACNLNTWNETLINPVTNLQAAPQTYGVADAQRLGGTNHIPAMGNLRIARAGQYNPGGSAGTGRQVNFRTVVQVVDANGNTINADGLLRILERSAAVPLP